MVQEAIDHAMIGRTVLVIAHRLSTVKDASRVLVISKGTIAEQGEFISDLLCSLVPSFHITNECLKQESPGIVNTMVCILLLHVNYKYQEKLK